MPKYHWLLYTYYVWLLEVLYYHQTVAKFISTNTHMGLPYFLHITIYTLNKLIKHLKQFWSSSGVFPSYHFISRWRLLSCHGIVEVKLGQSFFLFWSILMTSLRCLFQFQICGLIATWHIFGCHFWLVRHGTNLLSTSKSIFTFRQLLMLLFLTLH